MKISYKTEYNIYIQLIKTWIVQIYIIFRKIKKSDIFFGDVERDAE